MANDKLASHIQKMTATLNDAPDAEDIRAAAKSPIADHVANEVLNRKNSDKVTLYLARHPEELRKLNRLPEAAARARVGEISEQQESGGDLKDFFMVRGEQERIKRGRR